jgi:hypothetical protein
MSEDTQLAVEHEGYQNLLIDQGTRALTGDVDRLAEIKRRFRSKTALFNYMHDKMRLNVPRKRKFTLKFMG